MVPQVTPRQDVDLMLSFAIQHEFAVSITYVDAAGDRSVRIVEPYRRETTLAGREIVRTLDRQTCDYRTFRLDRIEDLSVLCEPFIVDRADLPGRQAERAEVEDRPEPRPAEIERGALVDYHGSKTGLHGVLMVHGPCTCGRHPRELRWRLAFRSSDEPVIYCVRPTSFRVIDDAEADEIEAFVRVRMEIADVDPRGYEEQFMRWTPDCPPSL